MKQGDIILILQKKNSSVIVKKWGLAPFIVIASGAWQSHRKEFIPSNELSSFGEKGKSR